MNSQPLIWIEDEAACYFDEFAQDNDKDPAVQWLETVFTGRWALSTFHDANLVPGPEYLRPVIELIDQADDDDFDNAMIVTWTDFCDPGRWWL
jgi:hypothetical protein